MLTKREGEKYNRDHFQQVFNKRSKLGLNNSRGNVKLKDHPLVGRKIKDLSSQEVYNIQSVSKQWYQGWYYGLLIEYKGSHGFIFWENESCEDETMLGCIDKTRQEYSLI